MVTVTRFLRSTAVAAAIASGCFTVALADDAGDQAIMARQGFMELVLWDFKPLGAMAKGDAPYDAATAERHAMNLDALSRYTAEALFVEGTAKTDKPGKTRAIAAIWEKHDDFAKRLDDWRAAVQALPAASTKGREELAKQVAAVGKTCGGCHDNFRAKSFD